MLHFIAVNAFILFVSFGYIIGHELLDDDEFSPVKKEVPIISASERASFYEYSKCQHADMELGKGYSQSCLVAEDRCMRRVVDGLFSYEEIQQLKKVAAKGNTWAIS